MGKRELVALLNVSSWCLVMVEWLFLAVLWGYLRFVIVVFPDHTHLLFIIQRAFFLQGSYHLVCLTTFRIVNLFFRVYRAATLDSLSKFI